MFQIAPATRPTSRAAFFLTLTALLVSACGLGMDTEARMMRMRGHALLALQQPIAARESYTQVLEPIVNVQNSQRYAAEPDNFVAANNLAWNYFESGDPRAEEAARRAYAMQPDNAAVVDTLGWILIKNGALQEGTAMLRNAVELDNGRPEIRFHLAAGLAVSGEAVEARNVLQQILAAKVEFASRREAQELLATL